MISYNVAAVWTLQVALAAAQMSSAPAFSPLTLQAGYDDLPGCAQACLTKGRDGDKWDSDTAARTNCPTFTSDLAVVSNCYTSACSTDVNATQLYEAQSVLAAFCTSVGNEYGLTIPNAVPALTTGQATIYIPESSSSAPSSIESVTTPTATGSASGVDPVSSTANPGTAIATTSVASGNSGSLNSTASRKSGFTASDKVGVGVGIGLGLPILLGGIAVFFFFTRRRKSRSTSGPYGPVMTTDKGISESGSYGSPHVQPHEMHRMSSAAPFLPSLVTHDMGAMNKKPLYEPSPAKTGHSFEQQDRVYEQPGPQRQPDIYQAMGRPATSRDVSRASTPPTLDTQQRPVTAPQHLEAVEDEEPPSPVSPVSPVSAMTGADSRPASLRHSVERG